MAPTWSAARRALVTSTSTTAAWNEAATSADATSGCLRTWLTTDVLSPLKLKSSPSSSIARGKWIASGSPRNAAFVDRRTTRIAELEEPRHLVERLTGGVVDRLAEQAVLAVPAHLDQHRVAARHEQHDERELERRIFEERRVAVRLEVVDADERHVPRQRQRLGRRDADQQGADQARPDGAGDGIDA